MNGYKKKIITNSSNLQTILKKWRKEKQIIVFTNGCFDILHAGHIKLLKESKKLGDKLIIGLNNDESIRNLKGKERPINNNYNRSIMLAAFSFVDLIVFFSDETPLQLIGKISPNVLTKGADYSINSIVGAKKVLSYGGDVKIIPLIPNLSTTDLIKKYKL